MFGLEIALLNLKAVLPGICWVLFVLVLVSFILVLFRIFFFIFSFFKLFFLEKIVWVSTQNIKLAGSPKALCCCFFLFFFLSLSLCWPKLLWKKPLLLFFLPACWQWLDWELHWCLMLLCHQMAQMLAKPGSSGQLPINPNLVAAKMSAVSTCGLSIWHSLQIFCIIYKLCVCFGVGFFSLHILWCWFKFKFKILYCPLQSQQLNGNSSSLTPALPHKIM